MSSSPFPRASIELDYPLYALTFDPQNANRLIVGGGGGASRTGVGNKISVLETQEPEQLRLAGELELPRDEDSVMSLAFGGHEDDTSYVFAGVNSSPEDLEKGKNRHLRCLSIEHTQARASAGGDDKIPEAAVAELSRTSLFQRPDPDTYQRLLRTAGRVGAAASGMGKEHQLAVFDAAWPNPKLRSLMELPKDAEELDVIQSGEGEHLVAFCYKYELHLVRVDGAKKKKTEPELIFTMTDDHGERPSFRSIRFLTPTFLLAASNLAGRSGVILQGFRLPTPTQEKARIAASIRIPGKISATALAVANVCPSVPAGKDSQFAIAVAANDSSVYLYTVEHKVLHSIEILSNLFPLHTLKNIHNGDSITGVAFSTFTSPQMPSTHTQFLRLASITLQKGVAVHSIPLKKHVTDAAGTSSSKSTRYVIAMRSKAPSPRSLLITLSIIVLVLAMIGQGIMELYGNSRPILHAHKFFPGLYSSLRNPDYPPAYFSSQEYLLSKLSSAAAAAAGEQRKQPEEGETLVIWQQSEQPATAGGPPDSGVVVSDIKLDVHDEGVHGPAKLWEDLSPRQQDAWREKLKKAGAWTQNMGESVFKGILFGELAGAVGRAMAG